MVNANIGEYVPQGLKRIQGLRRVGGGLDEIPESYTQAADGSLIRIPGRPGVAPHWVDDDQRRCVQCGIHLDEILNLPAGQGQGCQGEKRIPEKAYRFDLSTRTSREQDYLQQLEGFIEGSEFSRVEQMQNFAMYTPRQDLTRFLCRYECFKRVLTVHGSIVECGCLFGGGVMAWAQLSSIFEPFNHQRRVIGFDTFAGHAGIDAMEAGANAESREGGHAVNSYVEILTAAKLADTNRPVGHIPKVELVRGDACETIPQWLQDNPHALVSLLYLDFDIYAPTEAALKHLLPRMVSGGLVCFDEANVKAWPGETQAFLRRCQHESLACGAKSVWHTPKLERFPWGSTMCFYEVR